MCENKTRISVNSLALVNVVVNLRVVISTGQQFNHPMAAVFLFIWDI